jgi:tRNA pseudouridine55 synthase
MSRRSPKRSRFEVPGASGFLVVDKPAGQTSHDIVDEARRWFGTRRVGHLGTLDPQATGVLPLAIRQATKLIPFIEARHKVYDGTIVLGSETDTLDAEGEVVTRHEGPLPGREEVLAALARFRGDVQQVPPMYSAVKKDGVPLHRLARQGIDVEREPKWVTIDSLELMRFESPSFDLRVHCSAGTYVRVLASDLGRALGCGAHLSALRRTQSGPFRIEQARTVETCAKAAAEGSLSGELIAPAAALGFPVLAVSGEQQRRLQNGGDVAAGDLHREAPGKRITVVDGEGQVLAVAELGADRRVWPLRVLAPEPEGRG